MFLRRVFRLGCLSIASFFWTSCSDDSCTQVPVTDPEIADPDSSTGSAGEEKLSSAADETPSSSESAEKSALSSSSEEAVEESSSSEAVEMSSAEIASSSSEASEVSSSSVEGYVLAKDSSVTCEEQKYRVAACSSTKGLSCDDYKRYLASDTSLSEKLLSEWEDKLQRCGAVQEPVVVYGVIYDPCATAYYEKVAMKCSNDSTYKDFKLDGNKVYTSIEEYNEAHGISSSSVAESSSSQPEDLVQNCPQEGFALFADVLAEVQEDVYEKIIWALEEPSLGLTEAQRQFYEGLLDRENKKLKGNLSPYYMDGRDHDVLYTSLSYESKNWFDGYIARTKTCSDGTSVVTKRYREMYEKILKECFNIIDTEFNQIN